jgi:GTP 3',8-cyclase
MRDGFGRRVEYLRISVTDKCNLRCVYCMPEEGLPWLRREELLSYEEIARIVRVMAGMGLRRVRITGGEPLVRRDLPRWCGCSAPSRGSTTSRSPPTRCSWPSRPRRSATRASTGSTSRSTRCPERIDAISRRPGSAAGSSAGLDAAERVGFAPIKINCVVMRGRNDDEVADFAAITRERPWHVRFIEVMPTGDNLGVSRRRVRLRRRDAGAGPALGELRPVAGPGGNGPATYFAFPGAPGTVGVITPMSHNYCDRCNRMRLTADGQLRPCLFGDLQTNLRDPLRAGEPLEPLIRETLRIKPERHWLVQGSDAGSGGLLALSEVGGMRRAMLNCEL